jgi:lipopolysaccharide export system protein LptC
MKYLSYLFVAFMASCTQQPKPEKPDYSDYYMYHLEDTIYSEDGEIMMYKADGKLIWEHVGNKEQQLQGL